MMTDQNIKDEECCTMTTVKENRQPGPTPTTMKYRMTCHNTQEVFECPTLPKLTKIGHNMRGLLGKNADIRLSLKAYGKYEEISIDIEIIDWTPQFSLDDLEDIAKEFIIQSRLTEAAEFLVKHVEDKQWLSCLMAACFSQAYCCGYANGTEFGDDGSIRRPHKAERGDK